MFSATLTEDRVALGERVESWLRQHPELRGEEAAVLQSSCAGFHCLTIVVFYSGCPRAPEPARPSVTRRNRSPRVV